MIKKIILLLPLLILLNPSVSAENTTNRFFKKDKTPIILDVTVESPGSNMSGYVGCKITINGANFIKVTEVMINRIPIAALDFTVVNETTIICTAIAATGYIEVKTKDNGTALYGTVYTNLGYITADSGNWNQESTWLNKKIPPNVPDLAVTIAHKVNATTGILNLGTLTINKAGEFIFSNVIKMYGKCINKGTLIADGTLKLLENSKFQGNSPVYSYPSILQYVGYKGDVQDEWIGNGINAGAGTPSWVQLNNGSEIKIPTGKRALESGITIGDACTLTLGSGDITIGGNWNKSNSGIFNPGLGSVIFRGSEKQEIIGDNTFTNITINNPNGVAFLGSTSITGTLNLILGKVLLGENDLTMLADATIKGINNRRYIVTSKNGKLWQKISQSGTVYPIGNMSYNPVTFSAAKPGLCGVSVVDSIPLVFNKEKMINRMWAVNSESKMENLTVLAQFSEGEKGKYFDAANTLTGFYGNGWNTHKAVLTKKENLISASAENLTSNSGEQYLLIGNYADIKTAVEPAAVLKAKEPEPELSVGIPFDVVIRPNPFVKNTKISINSADVKKEVKIYDATGKLMFNQVIEGKGLQRITVGQDFPSGVYTAIIITNKSRKTLRIIKR